jgi:AcrR family transcriptional regulator
MISETATRSYRMRARAVSAAETRRKIILAAGQLWLEKSIDDITLQDVADRAGVTMQTVIRHFGSKDGLTEACITGDALGVSTEHDEVPTGNIDQALDYKLRHYESDGVAVLRTLALEEKLAAAKSVSDNGRAVHRAWCARVFAPYLPAVGSERYTTQLDAFVAATDIYLWKLLRLDLGRTAEQARHVISALLHALADHSPVLTREGDRP